MGSFEKPLGLAHTYAGRICPNDIIRSQVYPDLAHQSDLSELTPEHRAWATWDIGVEPIHDSSTVDTTNTIEQDGSTRFVSEESLFLKDLLPSAQDLFFGNGRRVPSIRSFTYTEGDDFTKVFLVSGQKPNKTANEILEATQAGVIKIKELSQEAVADAYTEIKRRVRKNSDKATSAAIAYTCAEIILDLSDNGQLNYGLVQQKINDTYPTLIEDELFQQVLNYYKQNPDNFKERFTNHNDEQLAEYVKKHPARAIFKTIHGIESDEHSMGVADV